MIVTLKTIEKDRQEFYTCESEEDAIEVLRNFDDHEDAEFLVDIAEVKNYKEKYEEIYALLFSEYADKDREVKLVDTERMVVQVKYHSVDYEAQRIKTFSSINEANTFIENECMEDDFSAQMLVNISEVKDYKEKYDEFYGLMIDSYKSKKGRKPSF